MTPSFTPDNTVPIPIAAVTTPSNADSVARAAVAGAPSNAAPVAGSASDFTPSNANAAAKSADASAPDNTPPAPALFPISAAAGAVPFATAYAAGLIDL